MFLPGVFAMYSIQFGGFMGLDLGVQISRPQPRLHVRITWSSDAPWCLLDELTDRPGRGVGMPRRRDSSSQPGHEGHLGSKTLL